MGKFLKQLLKPNHSIVLVMILIGVFGSWLLFKGHAATPAIIAEPELGTVTAPALSIDDASASGGKAIAFKAGNSPGGGQPNVLVLVNDDQRPEDIALRAAYMPKTYGPGGWMSTTKAVDYPLAQVSNPNCCPSRASIMTGRYDHNNGVKKQIDSLKINFSTTIQHYLHQSGYQTGLVGKFLNNFPDTSQPPDFDDYAMYESASYTSFRVNDNQTMKPIDQYATTYWGDRMLQTLRTFNTQPAKPWYIYGTAHVPHVTSSGLAVPDSKYASAPTRNCVAAGESDVSDKPSFMTQLRLTPAQVLPICQSQIRALMSYDDQLDRIFSYLQASGQLANTLVIVSSDNGYLWGEHNRSAKFVPYMPSVRVPLTVRFDGHLQPGMDYRLASNVDYAPTIMAATGIAKPAISPVFDGRSLLLPGGRTTIGSEYWYDTADSKIIPDWAQLTAKSWTFTRYYDQNTGAVKAEEYYDLKNDPGELVNLLGDSNRTNDPTNLTQLRSQITAFRQCAGTSCP